MATAGIDAANMLSLNFRYVPVQLIDSALRKETNDLQSAGCCIALALNFLSRICWKIRSLKIDASLTKHLVFLKIDCERREELKKNISSNFTSEILSPNK